MNMTMDWITHHCVLISEEDQNWDNCILLSDNIYCLYSYNLLMFVEILKQTWYPDHWANMSPLSSSIPLYRDYVQYWAERGVEVVGWTINTAVDKQYYQDVLKISYITDSLREDCEPHYWLTHNPHTVLEFYLTITCSCTRTQTSLS